MSHNKTLLFVSNACQGFANLLLGLTSNIKKRMLGRQKHSKNLMGRHILTKSVRKFCNYVPSHEVFAVFLSAKHTLFDVRSQPKEKIGETLTSIGHKKQSLIMAHSVEKQTPILDF